jgi:tripartite-type tricarboxylate transporter receptor subunit TctC
MTTAARAGGWRFIVAALVALGAAVSAARADEYPSKPIHIYNGFPAGSGADVLTRFFGDKLRPLAGQPIIVENKVGALGNIAAETVVHAKPDGYSMLITPNSAAAANVHLFRSLPFDPVKDLVPVTTLAQLPFVLVVSAKSQAASVRELSAALTAKGGKATFGYANSTSLASAELYKTLAKVPATAVAYKGVPQSITDLISGELDFVFADATFSVPQVEQGTIRPLAVTSAKRSAALPNVPTMAEAGVAGYDLVAWFAAFLPAGTPAPIADKLSAWLNQIQATDEAKEFLLKLATETFPGSPQSLKTFQASEIDKWGAIVKAAKIEPQ